jgi:hypothetical protein
MFDSEVASIKKVTGGYILNVRWPLAGTPIGGGEIVCITFDEAVSILYKHLHPDAPMDTKVVTTIKNGEHK